MEKGEVGRGRGWEMERVGDGKGGKARVRGEVGGGRERLEVGGLGEGEGGGIVPQLTQVMQPISWYCRL